MSKFVSLFASGLALGGVLALVVTGLVLLRKATNILNFYSCGLAALSFGLKVARWKVSLVAGVLASAELVVVNEAGDFAKSFQPSPIQSTPAPAVSPRGSTSRNPSIAMLPSPRRRGTALLPREVTPRSRPQQASAQALG